MLPGAADAQVNVGDVAVLGAEVKPAQEITGVSVFSGLSPLSADSCAWPPLAHAGACS
jgi:hypothetical protein